METVKPLIRAIAWTYFHWPVDDVPWTTDGDNGPALVEFAGRACYQSWSKPNPATATNANYIRHILDVGHWSVLEHGSVTFYMTGVSRSFTHELIRHRHLSYSQLSQRYVQTGVDGPVVEPELIAQFPELHKVFADAVDTAQNAYETLVAGLEKAMPAGQTPTVRRKLIRQAARAVLPNATETRIVVTGNYRAWRHFVNMRATELADVEIRQVAIAVLRELQAVAPNVFDDYEVYDLPDGTQAARTPHAEQA